MMAAEEMTELDLTPPIKEALKGPDADKWQVAIQEELAAMHKFGVWDKELVEL